MPSLLPQPEHQTQYVIEKLHQLTQGRAIIATEVGQNQMWRPSFTVSTSPTPSSPRRSGDDGFRTPAAIGAQLACPDRTVVNVAGDGSIQMNIQELATIVHYGLPVKVVILNIFTRNDPPVAGALLWTPLLSVRHDPDPDFVKLAEAYGIKASGRQTQRGETGPQGGLETSARVMDFHVEPEENVYPMVKPGTPLTEMTFGKVRAAVA